VTPICSSDCFNPVDFLFDGTKCVFYQYEGSCRSRTCTNLRSTQCESKMKLAYLFISILTKTTMYTSYCIIYKVRHIRYCEEIFITCRESYFHKYIYQHVMYITESYQCEAVSALIIISKQMCYLVASYLR